MPHREYRDADGTLWNVWQVIPEYRRVSPRMADGWLAFESATGERRRLSPIPASWETMSDAELDLLRRTSVPAPPKPPWPFR